MIHRDDDGDDDEEKEEEVEENILLFAFLYVTHEPQTCVPTLEI